MNAKKTYLYRLVICAVPLGACTTSPVTPAVTDHLVLVSQAGSSTVAVIDPLRGETVKRITVGMLPHRLLVARSGEVYAVLVGSQAVAEIDPVQLEVKRTMLTAPVPMTKADGSPIQGHVDRNAAGYSSCFACHNDAASGVKPLYVGGRPVGLTLSPDERELVVSHLRETRLSVLNRSSGALERTWSLTPAGTANEAADIARVGSRYAVSLRPKQPSTVAGALRWLDSSFMPLSVAPLSDQPLGSDPSALLPLEKRNSVLISNFESNTVTEFRADTAGEATGVEPGPLGALSLPDGRVLVLNYYSNSLSVVNLETHASQTVALRMNAQTFVNPTHAALSPSGRTAYIVSSGTDGHLLVFDLATLTIVRAIPIDGLSFDVAVIPANASSPSYEERSYRERSMRSGK